MRHSSIAPRVYVSCESSALVQPGIYRNVYTGAEVELVPAREEALPARPVPRLSAADVWQAASGSFLRLMLPLDDAGTMLARIVMRPPDL